MKKFSELFIKYKEIIMYLIMGFATTFISWVSYSIFTFVFSAFPDDTNVTAGNLLLSLLNFANLFPLEFSTV